MKHFGTIILLAIATAACDSASTPPPVAATAGAATPDSVNSQIVDAPQVELLEMPVIPDDISERGARAAYVVSHFWDSMDFRDTIRSHNNDFVAQNFANYVSLFPLVDMATLETSVSGLLKRAKVDANAFTMLTNIADHYLYDPNSPMRDELYYELFVKCLVSDADLSLAEREKFKFQLECINKNRQGSVATDFAYIDRQGTRRTLHTTSAEPLMMLVFFDPDCEECKKTLGDMKSSETLSRLIAGGRVTLLAIGAVGEEKSIRDAIAGFPATWHAGVDQSQIDNRGLYDLRAMPTIYILDANHRVLAKDILFEPALKALLGG